jgi:stearoyl-CoA desaturase (delta-9 desaturase)
MLLAAYCLAYSFLAGLAVNLGYHRCLSHRSLRLRKGLERCLITLGLPAGTPVQWAGNHRFHHACADNPDDPHSPLHGGFWHAHVGWYIGSKNPLLCFLYSIAGPLRTLYDAWNRPRTNQQFNHLAGDVATDPYYRFLSRPAPFFLACGAHVAFFFGLAFWIAGSAGMAALWLTSVLIYNLGDAIDSFAHMAGERPYCAADRARNNVWLGYLTLGEGWHANHHQFPESARHGLLPGQFDWTWQAIRLLEILGLASRVVVPNPERIREKLLTASQSGEAYGIYQEL